MKKTIIAAALAIFLGGCEKETASTMCDCTIVSQRQQNNVWYTVSTRKEKVPVDNGKCAEKNGYHNYFAGSVWQFEGRTYRSGATREYFDCR
jgi:hypothetical protein